MLSSNYVSDTVLRALNSKGISREYIMLKHRIQKENAEVSQ